MIWLVCNEDMLFKRISKRNYGDVFICCNFIFNVVSVCQNKATTMGLIFSNLMLGKESIKSEILCWSVTGCPQLNATETGHYMHRAFCTGTSESERCYAEQDDLATRDGVSCRGKVLLAEKIVTK